MPLTDRMPTAAKLVTALGLAAVGWLASEAVRPLLPEQTQFGWFNEVNVALGLVCGWVVTGSRMGHGISNAIGAGLTGGGALVFWGLLGQSVYRMLENSLARKYDGPMEGIVAVFEIGVDFGRYLADARVLGIVVIGGIVTGLAGEALARRAS